MKRKIYWNMCLVALAAIVLSSLMAILVSYNREEKQMKQEVVTEANYVKTALEFYGDTYLKELSLVTKGIHQNRITLIDESGTVLFDNFADNEMLENHKDRPEVQGAREKGIGEDTRISETLDKRTYYYAVLLGNGDVLRVANTSGSVLASLLEFVPVFLVLAVLVLVLSMILAEGQTRRIVKPINELDLDHPQENTIYDELAPLVGKIRKQQQTIQKQIDILKAKQKEFTAITENMSEGFIVVGKREEVVSYNSSAMKILGVEQEFVRETGANILSLNRDHNFRCAVDEALEGRHSEQSLELDGHFYQLIANPVAEGGEVNGAIIVILDVTEKQGREELRREFSANVSHELKTPLTSISGYAEIMKNGLVKAEDMRRFSENIYQEAQRMITLIEDIIKLSQLDETQVDLEKTEVDLYQIANEVKNRLHDHAARNQVTMHLDGRPVTVAGTRQILDEMIYNLCDNGIKYNHKGGEVRILVTEEDGHPVVSVSDNGIGIPKGEQERVFERFYRVDKSHSKHIGGTGLGLSIVKHGAIYHNARVEMDSQEGQGTKVRIIF